MRIAVFLAILISVPALSFAQTTWYVPDDFSTIQGAISSGTVHHGDTVLVRAGTYVENISFIGKPITVKSEKGANVTVIDGNHSGSVVTCYLLEGPDSVLDGFTITNGYADEGGGMFCRSCNPTVINCTFSENSGWYGGGMYNDQGNTTVTNCTFINNQAKFRGGGLYIQSSSPTVAHCTFTKNTTGNRGGGMYNLKSNPTVTSCTFYGNIVSNNPGYGGGMFNVLSNPTVTYCTFFGNTTSGEGGGMFNSNSNPVVANCSFSKNWAGLVGGGIYCGVSSYPTITNNTITKNSGSSGGGGVFCENDSVLIITNSILWDNNALQGPEIWVGATANPSTFTISYSDVKGGQSLVYSEPGCTLNWGSGMIDSDPLFVESADEDFHLNYTSPCRDSGDNSVVTELHDFEGDPRIAYSTVDMGVDEFYPHMYILGNMTPGGAIDFKLVGVPGTSPVAYFIGQDVWDPPLNWWPYGLWYLKPPAIGPYMLGTIPSPDGVITLSGNLPAYPPAPYTVFVHGIIGNTSTNLVELSVQ